MITQSLEETLTEWMSNVVLAYKTFGHGFNARTKHLLPKTSFTASYISIIATKRIRFFTNCVDTSREHIVAQSYYATRTLPRIRIVKVHHRLYQIPNGSLIRFLLLIIIHTDFKIILLLKATKKWLAKFNRQGYEWLKQCFA